MPIPARLLAIIVIVLALPGFGSGERLFAPSADLWPRWQAHDQASTTSIDHSAWDRFLNTYLRRGADGINRVAYSQVSATDRATLDAYIADLAAVRISGHRRPEQMAYWINLYNAVTVRLILDNLPLDSIQDIGGGLFGTSPWDRELVSVEGEALTLNDIEHRILRPIWRDPRIHYAVNCASIGCPDLRAGAYRASGLNQALDEAARAFVNHPRGLTISGDKVLVSRIYDWYIEDFGGDEAGVLRHLQHYAEPDLRRQLEAAGRLTGTHYDWRLNDVQRD